MIFIDVYKYHLLNLKKRCLLLRLKNTILMPNAETKQFVGVCLRGLIQNLRYKFVWPALAMLFSGRWQLWQ